VFAKPQVDFHFHRQNSDGTWSHKQGFSGQPQYTFAPDWDPNYGKSCGELCVHD
jgi:hypothetical protein